ncbi:MAG: hypothetical protein QY328_17035 [Anaerolineales bacterium]|jgi:hypothetical protein|nr:MAG: hypothetical protein QY328_17035 [Anaerolineales bacterium]
MRIIDKTPFQDGNGNIGLIQRVQGTLKYGLNWYPELEAQKKVIPLLDRVLDKGFVLIRNFTLPYSEIVLPVILIGPGSISIIAVTPVKGQFEAKGIDWNNVNSDGTTTPARRNLIDLVTKLARAFQKYLERKKIRLPVQIDSVIICSDPGAQVEAMRPMARVVRSDAIKQFANSLLQARPMMRNDTVYALADRIIDPEYSTSDEGMYITDESGAASLRAQSIFNAGESDEFDPNDLGIFRDAAANTDTIPPHLQEPNPARPRPKQVPAKKRILGMTTTQLIMLAGMLIVECCVLIGAVAVYFLFMTS